MLPQGAEAWDRSLDMQLTGKVVLSAAALLLVTAAYQLYKSRPARAPLGGGHAKSEDEEEAEGPGLPTGVLQKGLRCRRASKGTRAPLGCSREKPGGSCVPATAVTSKDGEPKRRDTSEEGDGQCPDSEQLPPPCRGQEAGAALGGKPDPLLNPHLGNKRKNFPSGPAAGDGSLTGSELAPWQDCGPTKEPVAREQTSLCQHWLAHTEGSSDMDKSWVFTRVSGVHREEAGTIQAASDLGLALHQQEGASNACYTFSSMARVQVEENFIEKVVESRPRLKGKVYEYYVESISQATSRGRPDPKTVALAGALSSVPGPLETRTSSRGHADDIEGGAEAVTPCQTQPPATTPGFSRKESLLQIVENPELQLHLSNFGVPAFPGPDHGASPNCSLSLDFSSAGSPMEPRVQLVARTNFFHFPLSPDSARDIHLDLGNCYEVLTLAKRQNLEVLKEAAYKVMSDNYLQVLRSPDIYDGLTGAERELILQRRLRGRQYLVVVDVCPQEDSGRLCCYDDELDTWHPLALLPPETMSRGCAICSLFNYLFVVSGCQRSGRQPSNRVFCYNPLTGIWSEVCRLSQARPNCQLVALDGYLYAIGGECLNTVERYDPRLDRWDFVPPLPNDTFALAHTATACAGEIFVTGGTLRYLLLRFSAQEQRWWVGPTGGGRERTVEMVAVNGFLYRFDLNRSLGIGVYRCSASTRLWYECATYRTPYPDAFQCAVVDNLIYCVGRQRTFCFLADHISPRFVPKELQSFPSPRGTLLPTVLTLPAPSVPQTRV
ncbi:kelch domain-containing protein 7A [Orycteropus afer afer]|uniref:Kelch domain-containing protein 7A n=1 Tax=Orycteropus afer afer TaxID=1230840 RepID=A0A8B6ZDT5_ORYAF|nr:kelch domain-containing protein 7A [Orycteropus afer afer]